MPAGAIPAGIDFTAELLAPILQAESDILKFLLRPGGPPCSDPLETDSK